MNVSLCALWRGESYTVGRVGMFGDLVAFERQFGVPASKLKEAQEEGEVPLEWFAFLVFRSLRRDGVFEKSLSFEDFCDDLEAVEAKEVEGESVDPTDPAPLTTS